jgi:membrane fusion protein, multidrug efflux system
LVHPREGSICFLGTMSGVENGGRTKETDMATATSIEERIENEVFETEVLETGETKQTRPRPWKRLLMLGSVAAVVAAGSLYWLHARHYEETDDAQVDGHFALLSTRITGTVAYVNPEVENDRFVKAGALLLALDPRDYEAVLEHAKANLEAKQAGLRTARLQVPITNAAAFSQLQLARAAREEALQSVAAAEADLAAAEHRVQQDEAIAGRVERDRARYELLVAKREISRSFYDARETEAAATVQALESDRAAVKAAEQKIAQTRSLVLQREAQIAAAQTAPQQSLNATARSETAQAELDAARAEVHTAELNLSYARIYAPVGGVVGHKTVELGHRVQPGQSLLTIVPVDDIWVTANFKETQLRHMRPGQAVSIHVDSFDRDYDGTVENLAGAAGPLFSLFPPENASGNYVKIVQRFPVRVHITNGQDPEHRLRPGMSVECSVRVR